MAFHAIRLWASAGAFALCFASSHANDAMHPCADPASGLCQAQALSMVQKEASVVPLTLESTRQDQELQTRAAMGRGNSKCPCIGISFTEGKQNIWWNKTQIWFPAGVGSKCYAWENGTHPECTGSNAPDWCSKSWCFVDPCNCDLDEHPPNSFYFPKATYQTRPLHYSYQTCGGDTDAWFPQHYQKEKASKTLAKCIDQKAESDCAGVDYCGWDRKRSRCLGKDEANECEKPLPTTLKNGNNSCPCIGIDGLVGTIKGVVLKHWKEQYPADIGGTCKAWDADLQKGNPGCDSDGTQPHWCLVKFCYVDPCHCVLPVPPKRSSYFVNATSAGGPLYFSYETCGNEYEWELDNFAEYADECINQRFPELCSVQADKCAWVADRCLPKELEDHCRPRLGII